MATTKRAKHTPGPWRASCGEEGAPIYAEGAQIAYVGADEIDEQGRERLTNEGCANASLIASAPDMLEALLAYREIARKGTAHTTDTEWVEALELLEAALTKAEGRS